MVKQKRPIFVVAEQNLHKLCEFISYDVTDLLQTLKHEKIHVTDNLTHIQSREHSNNMLAILTETHVLCPLLVDWLDDDN